MTENEFELQIIRLKETYGKQKYPEERKKIFWQKLQKLSEKSFINAISDFIANSERAPMLKDLEAALQNELRPIRAAEREKWERERREREKRERERRRRICPTCEGHGYYYKVDSDGNRNRVINPARPTFTLPIKIACHCPLGRKLASQGGQQTNLFV